MTASETVTTETQGHVFLIGLNRPEKMNSFNLAMLRQLGRAIEVFEADDDLRCAVLFGHGDHFTTGLDLAEVGPAVASGENIFPEGKIDIVDLSEPRRTKPLVCAVHGWCLTAGLELLLAADIRVGATDVRIAQMEVKRGIMPFGGGTVRLPQVAGWGNAMRYLLTGDEFGAEEALRIGVLQEVVEVGRQVERAVELAEAVARQAPLAVKEIIRSARLAVEHGPQAAVDILEGQARGLMTSEDAMEGMLSFIERREAKFKGK
ncbi:MAG: crotonase/enoyl-CoA hydratase family protein [Deltaproteobacteria bacterium]|nr:crotonase/enoyl-CoA hydratase family protein [Deltaproteobacteria bacterium]MBW1873737.1 crotonase/enoyl-CoA hydratase family protein [Deltaproteobacteria bacterium]